MKDASSIASVLLLLSAAAGGCTGAAPDVTPPAPEGQAPACTPGEWRTEAGLCQPAGIPPEACGDGFLADGDAGCAPILPAEPCARGLMAVPGDPVCREIAPCGTGKYGDIPADAVTQFVDGTYAGEDSDGTEARPWRTIQEGIDHAAPGAIVAVAAGTYEEDVVIEGKPVRLWGACPARVTIAGGAGDEGAVQVLGAGANGSEIRGLAVTGASYGIEASGMEGLLIDHVWIRETGTIGLRALDDLGPTGVTLSGSLIEAAAGAGVLSRRAGLRVEASVVRGTLPDADGAFGRGIEIEEDRARGEGSRVALRRSTLEGNREVGLLVTGAEVNLEAIVVRGTLPDAQGDRGLGVVLQPHDGTHVRAAARIDACLFEGNRDGGVLVLGSDARVSATVAAANRVSGLAIYGDADALIEASVARGNLHDAEGHWGMGVEAYGWSDGQSPRVAIRGYLSDRNHHTGLRIAGAEALIEGSVVRGTLPDGYGDYGRGIVVQPSGFFSHPDLSTATIRGCLLEDNLDVGMHVLGSDVTVESTTIRATGINPNGRYGDGIAVMHYLAPASAILDGVRVEGSARAGISNFGGAVELRSSSVACGKLPLSTQPYEGFADSFLDGGGNLCGCPEADGPCEVMLGAIAAPVPGIE